MHHLNCLRPCTGSGPQPRDRRCRNDLAATSVQRASGAVVRRVVATMALVRSRAALRWVLLVGLVTVTVFARADDRSLYTPAELAAIYHMSPLPKVPPDRTDRVADDPQAARLGQFLFFDPRLSGNGRISCASCHQPSHGFADARPVAQGLARGTRNTPTVLDAAFNRWYFWDGRADSLWSQALQPLENPHEAGGDRLHIAHVIDRDPALRHAYQQVFGRLPALTERTRFPEHGRPVPNDTTAPMAQAWRGMTAADRQAVNRVFSNVGKAIEAYERRLVRGHSPFDVYVRGLKTDDPRDQAAISEQAKQGLGLFVGAAHCDLCHSGPELSDGEFHNLGLPLAPNAPADQGREAGIHAVLADVFNGIGPYSDQPNGAARKKLRLLPDPATMLGSFKTPSLRNVALTAPYMHAGQFPTLRAVVQFYGGGKNTVHGRLVGTRDPTVNVIPPLTPVQITDMVAFLRTLTGAPLPHALTQRPARP